MWLMLYNSNVPRPFQTDRYHTTEFAAYDT